MESRRPWLVLLAAALAFVVGELQWAHWISWDEVEFFRATRWVGEGQVPFRDFWEHHLPLQWLLFAPFAVLFDGPGAGAVLAMRWVQLPLSVALLAILFGIMRRAGFGSGQRWAALLLLVTSTTFVRAALEYRVDLPGNLAYLGALALAIARPRARGAWIAFGALMSAAVLANMRLAPLVIATAAVLLVWRGDERRWGFNGSALAMIAGALAVAAAFLGWTAATGASKGLVEAMRFNLITNRMVAEEANTFFPALLQHVTTWDASGIVIWIGAAIGIAVALREIRRPAIPQLLAIVAVCSVAFVATLGVHYIYHFQTPLLLMAPLAVLALRGERAQKLAMLVIGIIVAVNIGRVIRPSTGIPMRYIDTVMQEVDARTLPHERVFDGVGYALNRRPAYRYWFLPAGVQMLAERGMIPPYGAREMVVAPPAAIVHSYRIHLWFRRFPDAATYATHHYVPLYRDLWIPGLSGIVPPGEARTWKVPRDGRYRFLPSPLLTKHPWFANPVQFPLYRRSDAAIFTIPLQRLPLADRGAARLTVNGTPVATPTFALRQGDIVRIESGWNEPMGVLIVPEDVTVLFIAPEARFVM
jgi:hypothetical protein